MGLAVPRRFATLFADRPELWDELRVVLARGGRFSSPSSFAAPYVYANWPEQFDSFECAAVTGTNVRLRSAPRLDAPIVAPVSYSIVRLIGAGDLASYGRAVQLGDGRTGYMWHAYVRSSVDYRRAVQSDRRPLADDRSSRMGELVLSAAEPRRRALEVSRSSRVTGIWQDNESCRACCPDCRARVKRCRSRPAPCG